MWIMWAHKDKAVDGSDIFFDVGSKWFCKLHGDSLPLVEVVVKEDINGKYKGWVESGKDNVPDMIFPEYSFEICFAYGSKIEVEKGKGIVVTLFIEEKNVS